MQVKLSEILFALETQTESSTAYVDRRTGEVIVIGEEEAFYVEEEEEEIGDEEVDFIPDWQRPIIEKAREIMNDDKGVFLPLPSQFDINEWEIMRNFALSLEDEKISSRLLDAIHGKGAFRRFRDQIRRFGIENDWYRYRDEALREIAIQWCKDHNIPYVED